MTAGMELLELVGRATPAVLIGCGVAWWCVVMGLLLVATRKW